jgi:hypothetical protein
MVKPSIQEQNLPDTIMPISARTREEVVAMMIQIETLQAQLAAAANQYADDQDTMFLLQTEHVNLAAVKQAILWAVGWSDALLTERALALYERNE